MVVMQPTSSKLSHLTETLKTTQAQIEQEHPAPTSLAHIVRAELDTLWQALEMLASEIDDLRGSTL